MTPKREQIPELFVTDRILICKEEPELLARFNHGIAKQFVLARRAVRSRRRDSEKLEGVRKAVF